MQTRDEYRRDLGWLNVGAATLALLVAILYLTEGNYPTVALLLGLAGMLGLQGADQLVWRGSQPWLRWLSTAFAVAVVALGCWALFELIAS